MACLHTISTKSVQWFPNLYRWTQVEASSHVHNTQSVYKVSGLDSQKNQYLKQTTLLLISLQHKYLTLYTYWHGHKDSERLHRT